MRLKFNRKNWPLLVTAIGSCIAAFSDLAPEGRLAIVGLITAAGALFGIDGE